MNQFKYKKFVVNTTNNWEREILLVNDWISSTLNPRSVRARDRFYYLNHPLVNRGIAFWLNHYTLCLGYKLKHNNNIFRPIFNRNRQQLMNEFQNNIRKIVLKREEKRAFIELIKIKKLPNEIIDKIVKIAY